MANNKVQLANGTVLIDITDTTAVASDVAAGKYFYNAAGVKTEGTASGGGGGGSVVVTDEPNATGTTAVVTADNVTTQHTIHLEFSDSTDTDISVYYNDSLLGAMITNYKPSTWTYNNKTVYIAELDGVEWYDATPSPATWETLINGNLHVNVGNPYGGIWISDLGSVSIALDSVWRVTFDNGESYILTATANGIYGSPHQNIIGNPLFMGGQDDGSDVPFCFEQNPWGAWTGGTDTSITQDVDHIVKIEQQVSA